MNLLFYNHTTRLFQAHSGGGMALIYFLDSLFCLPISILEIVVPLLLFFTKSLSLMFWKNDLILCHLVLLLIQQTLFQAKQLLGSIYALISMMLSSPAFYCQKYFQAYLCLIMSFYVCQILISRYSLLINQLQIAFFQGSQIFLMIFLISVHFCSISCIVSLLTLVYKGLTHFKTLVTYELDLKLVFH